MAADGSILALDVGTVRIGLALASSVARLAMPYKTLANTEASLAELQRICQDEHVKQLVIGLPRNLHGDDTGQTAAIRQYGAQLESHLKLPIVWQDEAVTSVQAEAELKRRGKPYRKEDIDALAATYILEDYLHENV